MFYFDDKMLTIGHFQKILMLSDKEVSISFKRYDLIISGDKLIVPYLEDKEIGVKGIIKNIRIVYKMVKDNV